MDDKDRRKPHKPKKDAKKKGKNSKLKHENKGIKPHSFYIHTYDTNYCFVASYKSWNIKNA